MSCGSSQQFKEIKEEDGLVHTALQPQQAMSAPVAASSSSSSSTLSEKQAPEIPNLPDRFENGVGPEYELLRKIYVVHRQEHITMVSFSHTKNAELLSLMFSSMLSIYDRMVSTVTMQNAQIFENIYNELATSCRELAVVRLIKAGVETPSIALGTTNATVDQEVGRKLFHLVAPISSSLEKHDTLVLSPNAVEWQKRKADQKTMFDLLYWHADNKHAFYIYASSMVAHISNALRIRCIFIANVLVRFTLFSIKLVTQLIECSSVADSSKAARMKTSTLFCKMNTVLLLVGTLISEKLIEPMFACEKNVDAEREELAMRHAMITSSKKQIADEVNATQAALQPKGNGGCFLL